MSQVKISGNASGTGILTVAAPNTNTDYTLTLPAETGTVLTSGTAAASIPGYGNITDADLWRLSANLTLGNSFVTANLERDDSTGFGYLGSGMTQSSGVFTFPKTGIWFIHAVGSFYQSSGASTGNQFDIFATVDNSTYLSKTESLGSGYTTGAHATSVGNFLFDVTDLTNCKVKFYQYGSNGILRGSSNANQTHVVFIRLGDT